MTFQQASAAVNFRAMNKPELDSLVGAIGEYQVFQVVDNDSEPNVVRYALLGPSPLVCGTFESLKDAMDAAHRLSKQPKSPA